MDYFRGAKNALYNTYTGIATKVKGVNHKSTFEQDGKLTPEEFEDACEKLCYVCPSWGWKAAVDKAHTITELPADKQFISTRIVSNERAKDVLKNVELITSNEDGWIEAKVKEDPTKKPSMKMDDEVKPQIKGAKKKFDDSDDDEPVAPKEEIKEAKTTSGGENKDKRYYDISITYDRYHHTPRLWLAGIKDDGTTLTNDEIFEDIMSDYAHKTVTIEDHPHLGTRQASIHPCKHAQVIHQLITEAKNNGVDIDASNALFIFLKFMSSVLPTLEFDYTIEITTNK